MATEEIVPRRDEALSKIVHERLIVQAKCYRHCDRDASFHELDSGGKGVVGLYACPSGYVSRIIYFDQEPDIEWYKGFLKSRMSEGTRVEGRDLRIATRHPWDLGLEEAEVAIVEGSLAPYTPEGGLLVPTEDRGERPTRRSLPLLKLWQDLRPRN